MHGKNQNLESETSIPKKGVYLKTFGCQMNEYDSLKLLKLLEGEYRPVDQPEGADLVLINTCSVRDKPEQKLYSLLGQLNCFKRNNPRMLIGVGGCVAQQEGEQIIKRSRTGGFAVDFVFGTHNLSLVPSLIARRKDGLPPQVAVNYRDEWEDLPLGFPENMVSVFVSISRGCNKNCTYCIVPVTRGKEVSRSVTEIEREIKIAVHRGAKEVVLLGQTVNSYGLDLSPRIKFLDLLKIVSNIEGVERIRFTSPHPQEVRTDFIDYLKENRKICRHIHMPLQSGSNTILQAMNRNYKKERYLKIIFELRDKIPELGITTDIIVGFPGETEEDFQETLEVMEQVKYQDSYSFVFSPRPGTMAAKLLDTLPYEDKLKRLYTLQSKQAEHTACALNAWIGKDVEVLLDGYTQADTKCLRGRLSQNIVVNLVREELLLKPGMSVMVNITEAGRTTLRGEYIDRESKYSVKYI